MPELDIPTLVTVESYLYFIAGGLTFTSSLRPFRSVPVLWISITFLTGGASFLIGVAVGPQTWGLLSVRFSNALLLIGYGCLWTGLRAYAGKAPRWPWIVAGGALWLALCPWPWFVATGSTAMRVELFSLITLAYLLASVVDLAPTWRASKWSVTPVMVILVLHGLFYAYRMAPQPFDVQSWPYRSGGVATVLENLLFVIASAFSILLMVYVDAGRRAREARLRDPLTHLPNRHALLEWGGVLLSQRAEGVALTALACAVDDLTGINARYGSVMGDRVLQALGGALRDAAQPQQLCARTAGNAFVVLAPGQTLLEVRQLATRIRQALAERCRELPCHVTLAVGICRDQRLTRPDPLLVSLDRALAQARALKADCVRVVGATAGPPAEPTPEPAE
ncbi:MAG TPA: GGDEF domain-containing protein [Nevskiaceae bacterium]|nr:GGDEF domain-containing protein [Nevskiaceae bacterium]